MKYYLAADGGGTKLLSVLYDENFNIITSGRTFGVNSYFKDRDVVIEEVGRMTKELIPQHVTQIERADMSFVGEGKILRDAVNKKCTVGSWAGHDEAEVALAAAGYRYGVVAQAGTGSDAFLFQEGKRDVVGAWGAFLGDEGGGYDIGIRTLRAAVYSMDGRGPKTEIYDILMEDWKLSRLWEAVGKLSSTPDWRGMAASATHITAKAAARGDKVALEIYENAGRELALQVVTLLRRYQGVWEGPIVASGGAWKGCGKMYERFREDVLAEYPDAVICRPVFEPLVGSVVLGCMERGLKYEDIGSVLKDKFSQYLL